MRWIDACAQDVRQAWRVLRKSPVLSIAIVCTLALGIGLDVGAYAFLDGALFQPRVEHDPDSFVQVTTRSATLDDPGVPLTSLDDFHAFKAQTRSLRELAAWTTVHATLARSADDDHATDLIPLLVTCNFFAVYGTAPPVAGRLFRDDECLESAPAPVVVIGEDLWRTRLGADPAIVGSSIALNRQPFTVVGIVRSGDSSQLRGGIWIPYTLAAAFHGGRDLLREPHLPWLMAMVGRLRPGRTRAEAMTDLSSIAHQQDGLKPGRTTTVSVSNGSLMESEAARPLAVWVIPLVMGALSLVLLLVCGNVAMLLLSRASARGHEIAVRLSIGATRSRLLQMLLTETLTLAAVAAPIGAVLAINLPRFVHAANPRMPVYLFRIDAGVLAYFVGVTALAGMLAGLAPALDSLRPDVSASLNGREVAFGARRKWRGRDLLIVIQTAMSVVLLVGGGLFATAQLRLLTPAAGYDAEHVLVVTPRVSLPPHTMDSAVSFYQALLERVRAVSGVQAVAFTTSPPIGGGDIETGRLSMSVSVDGVRSEVSVVNAISPGYFGVMGVRIERGRVFDAGTEASEVRPALVSNTLARRLTIGGDPLGRIVELQDHRKLRIVGVAADVRSPFGSPDLTVYVPRATRTHGDAMVVRFDGDAAGVGRAVRQIVSALDRNAVTEPRTLASLQRELAQKFEPIAAMTIALAAAALVLAMVGIYGLVSFATSRRMREMGIRIALGATRRDIVAIVLRSETAPLAWGLTAGFTVSLFASQLLTRALGRSPVVIEARDPIVYVTVIALIALAAWSAMLGPALKAASADPAQALRQD